MKTQKTVASGNHKGWAMRAGEVTSAVLLIVPVCLTVLWGRVGLTTDFVETVVDRLPSGRTYEVSPARTAFTLTNPGEKSVQVVVVPEVPVPETLRPGYTAIPHTEWVRVEPKSFRLNPGETKTVRVSLNIPKDARWKGKHFQVAFWSHTIDEAVGAGVRSRLCFSIGASAPTVSETSVNAAAARPALSFDPSVISLQNVESSETLNRLTNQRAALSLTNSSRHALRAQLRSVQFEDWSALPAGYVPAPNPDFLMPETAFVEIPAGEKRDVSLMFRIPSGGAHRGRRYAFLVKAESISPEVSSIVFSKIFVEVSQ